MSADGLPCRRCGTVTGDPVIIYGSDPAGAMVPRAAQCRGECPGRPRRHRSRPSAAGAQAAAPEGGCVGADDTAQPVAADDVQVHTEKLRAAAEVEREFARSNREAAVAVKARPFDQMPQTELQAEQIARLNLLAREGALLSPFYASSA